MFSIANIWIINIFNFTHFTVYGHIIHHYKTLSMFSPSFFLSMLAKKKTSGCTRFANDSFLRIRSAFNISYHLFDYNVSVSRCRLRLLDSVFLMIQFVTVGGTGSKNHNFCVTWLMDDAL